jgi:hypothetical protein
VLSTTGKQKWLYRHPVSVLPNSRPQKNRPSSAYDVSSRVYSQASMRQNQIKLLLFRGSTLRLKCDGTRAETRFRLSAKQTSPFKSAGASVQSTTGSRGVRISGSNAGYAMFRGSVKSTGYPLHSPVSPSLPLPRVTVCHHISTRLYYTYAVTTL